MRYADHSKLENTAVTSGELARKDIICLGELASLDHTVVGAKAANLSRLTTTHRIPLGFCLSASVFDRAGAASGAVSSLPPAVHDQIATTYDQLARRLGVSAPGIAVRSSAVEEDGGSISFAGQHESYLIVVGPDAVATAVRHCWESTYTARAIEYRRRHGIGLESIRLAVLVQRLIVADASAVAFNANPATESREEVVIETAWGLGESIVGGTVTPDRYVLRKDDLAVIFRRITDKHRMTVPLQGSTHEVETPSFLRTRPVLDDEQTMEIARLVMDLEREMGGPVDVECAYESGLLFLLQCRPVTALDGVRGFPTNPWKREENDTDNHERMP